MKNLYIKHIERALYIIVPMIFAILFPSAGFAQNKHESDSVARRNNVKRLEEGRLIQKGPSPLNDSYYKIASPPEWNALQSATATHNVPAWTEVGPNIKLSDGIGKISSIAFHATDPNILYIGAALGGVWKSIDGGNNWTVLNTDNQLAVVSVVDIKISAANYMYVATGDGYDRNIGSRGVFRSADDGLTYQNISTGLPLNYYIIKELFVYSNDIVYASTSQGLFRTLNAQSGSVTWSQVGPTEPFETVIVHPTNSSILYASGYNIYKSIDSGNNWTSMTGIGTGIDLSTTTFTSMIGGLPVGDRLFTLTISPLSPYNLYTSIIYSKDLQMDWTSDTWEYFFKFNGSTWDNLGTRPRCSIEWRFPNRMNKIAASPVNPDVTYLAGTNLCIYDANNYGTNSPPHFWLDPIYNDGGTKHPDIISMRFSPFDNNFLFVCTDGYLCKYNCTTKAWVNLTNAGLANATLYGFSYSPQDENMLSVGCQDAGSSTYSDIGGGIYGWTHDVGGDGYKTLLQNNNTMYYNTNYNLIRKTYSPLTYKKMYPFTPDPYVEPLEDPFEEPNWNCPLKVDPIDPSIAYYSARSLWKYIDYGNTGYGTRITDFQNPSWGIGLWQPLGAYDIAPSNNNVIYVAFAPDAGTPAYNNVRLFKTINGGTSWTEMTVPQPAVPLPISEIQVSPYDPNIIFISYLGYNPQYRVKKFNGTSWIDYNRSIDLPTDRQINSMVFERGSNNAVYLGTDVGVYYTNATMDSWIPYMNGLPNVVVTEVKIAPISGTLYAGTYGRGVWKTSLYCPAVTTDITIPGFPVPSDNFYETTTNITASAAVPSGVKTFYRAGHAVFLGPGFVCNNPSGSAFSAYVQTCSNYGTIIPRKAKATSNTDVAINSVPEDKKEIEDALLVYPVPSTGPITVKLKLKEEENAQKLEIYNIEGKKVFSLDPNLDVQKVDLSNLEHGIYIIKLTTNKRTIEKKIFEKLIYSQENKNDNKSYKSNFKK